MKYYTTKSKTLAYALQYVLNESFYKFTDEYKNTVYSFVNTDELKNKLEKLNELRFNLD